MTLLCNLRRARAAAVVFGAATIAVVSLLGAARPAAAAAAPNVTVRVEGASSTLLPLTPVTLEAPEPVSGCPANSATAAINLAVNGNWDHGDAEGVKGNFTQTVLGETHAFTNESDTWAVWIDDKWGGGICEDLLAEGDEVLLVADHEPAPAFAPTVLPLVIAQAPPTAVAGTPIEVQVNKIHTRPGTFAEIGEGTPQPEEGVTVAAAGATAVTGPNGVASLTVSQPGTYALTARKAGDAPAAPVTLCVRAGASGCGITTSGPGSKSSTPAGSAGGAGAGPGAGAGSYRGPFAIVAQMLGLSEGHVYRGKQAPRLLTGRVVAHAFVSSVAIELRRRYRGRCFSFDGVRARFVRARCGQGKFFGVGSGPSFSYLLPAPLAPGRYVLDIQATDAAGNHTTLARGTSRTVFYVR